MSNRRKLTRSAQEQINRIGARIEEKVRQHFDQIQPDLPVLDWSAEVEDGATALVGGDDGPSRTVEGWVMDPNDYDREYSDSEVWEIVTRYAAAMGSDVHVSGGEDMRANKPWELETEAVVRGVRVVVIGSLASPRRFG